MKLLFTVTADRNDMAGDPGPLMVQRGRHEIDKNDRYNDG